MILLINNRKLSSNSSLSWLGTSHSMSPLGLVSTGLLITSLLLSLRKCICLFPPFFAALLPNRSSSAVNRSSYPNHLLLHPHGINSVIVRQVIASKDSAPVVGGGGGSAASSVMDVEDINRRGFGRAPPPVSRANHSMPAHYDYTLF